jgi:branched-chain amino acid transport system substrate-binding protein
VNENPTYFPQMPNDRVLGVAVAGAIVQVAKEAGRSKIALLYCAEVPGCKVVNTSGKEVFARAGIQSVYEGQASLAQPDYTAECLAARNAGADILFPTLDLQSIPRLSNSCASIGYRPLFAWVATTTAPSLAATPSLDGAAVGSPTVPWFAGSSPPVAEFTATMKQHAPSVAIDGAAIHGWTSAKLFERAARDIGATVTAHDILKGLWSIKNEDLGGLTVPLTFAEGQQKNGNLTPCWWTVVIRGGKYTALNGAQRQCP